MLIDRDGEVYCGQFVNGLRHGPGLVRIKSQLTRNVMGEMIDSKVSFIEGSFVADKLEGPGMVRTTLLEVRNDTESC